MEAATSETIYTSQLPANILMLIFSDDLLYSFNINAGQYLVAFLFYFITSVFVIFFLVNMRGLKTNITYRYFFSQVDDVLYLTTMY